MAWIGLEVVGYCGGTWEENFVEFSTGACNLEHSPSSLDLNLWKSTHPSKKKKVDYPFYLLSFVKFRWCGKEYSCNQIFAWKTMIFFTQKVLLCFLILLLKYAKCLIRHRAPNKVWYAHAPPSYVSSSPVLRSRNWSIDRGSPADTWKYTNKN